MMRPNCAEDWLELGALNITLLKMLKNSARNSRATRSTMFVRFVAPKSVLK